MDKLIRTTGSFSDCMERRVPCVNLRRTSQTFSYVDWDILCVYWLIWPEPQELIQAMDERGCRDDEIRDAIENLPTSFSSGPLPTKFPTQHCDLAKEINNFYLDYKARTQDRQNKITGQVGVEDGISGGFVCRSEDGMLCYKFLLDAVARFVDKNPPAIKKWLG